jgi:glycopeptide antibiotics resistance protein
MQRPVNKILFTLFVLYLFALVYFILVKYLQYFFQQIKNFDIESIGKGIKRANFIPFKTIMYYVTKQEKYETGALNLGGNIALFMPLGVFLFLLYRSSLKAVLLIAFFLSLFFELLQLIFNVGNLDPDDLLLNVTGALLGWLLLKGILKAKE